MSKCNKYRGGYIAPYSSSPNSSEYMLNSSVNADAIANINYANNKASDAEIYVPPTATPIVASTNTPGIQGGQSKKARDANDKLELEDNFYYSLEGGCACNGATGGSGKKSMKGGDFVLTPFISALALLGARMLADKNSGFNMKELFGDDKEEEVKGGARKARKTTKKQPTKKQPTKKQPTKPRKMLGGSASCSSHGCV
jgi:hypothetical protein